MPAANNIGVRISEGFGDGVDANILDAYIFLCNNHVDWDDEIFIFGFSRGAFTARVLANLVVRLGLFRKSVSWMTRRAWSQYVEGPESFDFFVNQLNGMRAGERSGFTKPVNVKVLGVWDTVGAIGIPDYNAVKVLRHDDKNKFYDTRLHYGMSYWLLV